MLLPCMSKKIIHVLMTCSPLLCTLIVIFKFFIITVNLTIRTTSCLSCGKPVHETLHHIHGVIVVAAYSQIVHPCSHSFLWQKLFPGGTILAKTKEGKSCVRSESWTHSFAHCPLWAAGPPLLLGLESESGVKFLAEGNNSLPPWVNFGG